MSYGSIDTPAKPRAVSRGKMGAAALAALALVATAVVLSTRATPTALYEYHVPGDYLGGDGGMDSDYDDVLAPSEFYGMDQKGDAPFGDLRGFGPADRMPTYQVCLFWILCQKL